MVRIRSLRPNVTRDQAILQFSSTGIPRLFRNAAFGRLRSVAELYLPFRLFQVQIVNRGARQEQRRGRGCDPGLDRGIPVVPAPPRRIGLPPCGETRCAESQRSAKSN